HPRHGPERESERAVLRVRLLRARLPARPRRRRRDGRADRHGCDVHADRAVPHPPIRLGPRGRTAGRQRLNPRPTMPIITDVPASAEARALHAEALVFDGLAIAYVLDEKFTQRCLEGGVHAANVTFALEENWDKTLANFERHLSKIDKSPLLALCRT